MLLRVKRTPRLADFDEKLTAQQFWGLVGQLEHEQLDFKVQAKDLTTLIAAMAMTDGGLVVLGIDDDRQVKGCPLTQETQDRVMKAAHACGVSIQMREVSVAGVRLTVVAIPEVRGRIVTTPDGRLVRRVGGDNQPLVADALGRFVRERQEHPAEDEAIAIPNLDDFDLPLINRALRMAECRPSLSRAGIPRALVDLGLALPESPPAGPAITCAAALLFARDPRVYVPAASVQIVRRAGVGPGPGPTRARVELTGPLPKVLDKALAFVRRHTGHHETVVGKHREVLPEYPISVLREALLNAVSHRDYGLAGATVDVTIWDDRIEVHSPGSLPGHITLKNIRDEHYSRNRRIMRVLKLLGLVEEYGEGVDRMFREMEARLMEPPVFAATPSSVTVTLHNRSLLTVEDQAWLGLLGHLDLTAAERRILVATRKEGAVTRRRVRELLPDGDAEALLAAAVAKGLLVRTGERGGARYVPSDEIVMRAGATGLEAQSRKRQMLLDEIRRRGSLSTVEGAELLEDDVMRVRHLLNDLVRARLAIARGQTRGRRYYPAQGS